MGSVLHNDLSVFKSDSRQEVPLPTERFKILLSLQHIEDIDKDVQVRENTV